MAVAMQCSAPGIRTEVQAQLSIGQEHRAAGPSHAHQSEGHVASDDSAHGAAHDHASADKCNLCATSCAATALISAPMTVAEQQSVSAVFPDLHALPPSFVPDGQERPPRTT